MSQIDEMTAKIVAIQKARDWKQFMSTKNVAIALVAEAGELAGLYRYDDNPPQHKVSDEAGDVVYNALLFCQEAGLDVEEILNNTLAKIERKYPAEQWRGKNHKYDE